MVSTRITTNMISRNYQTNLNSSLGGLESARKQVETGRRFCNSYEDPSASAKAAILERRYSQNDNYLNSAKNIQNWIYAQEDVGNEISSASREIVENYSTSAVSDTNASERATYAELLRNMQKSMVQSLNSQYANTFVMAGGNGNEAPFKLEGNTLTYRGIDVSDPNNQEILDKLANEHSFIDLGFGLTNENGEITEATAFDTALPGIKLIGFGVNNGPDMVLDGGTPEERQVPKNLVVLAGEMAAELEKGENFDRETYGKLWDQFHESYDQLTDEFTGLGTKENMLTTTIDRLEKEKLSITEQFDTAVNIDPAEAITNYSWATYVYNTALKVGTSIISPSLLDFMR